MNGLALIIGINDYETMPVLDNAVADAQAIADALERLGFIVKLHLNCGIFEFHTAVSDFGTELSGFDLGLVYFAGHGFEFKGKNYLGAKEIIHTTEFSISRDSIALSDLIDKMDESGVKSKVIILDACRKPFNEGTRGFSNPSFGPIFAPKGTLIAFSTSPGEAALDGTGDHSHYTSAFLKHLEEPGLEIETFFKRVRTTLTTVTSGRQTSWEHTSLIGPVQLNSGQLRHAKNLPYAGFAIADGDFKTSHSGSATDVLIIKMRGNYYQQNAAIDAINKENLTLWDDDHLFLLGRAIIGGGENNALSVVYALNNLSNWLVEHGKTKMEHILNGMLYEIFFDSKGLLRRNRHKIRFFNEIMGLESDHRFKASFDLINGQLKPFERHFPYLPSAPPASLPIDLEITRLDKDTPPKIMINAIQIHGNDITIDRSVEEFKYKTMSDTQFIELLSTELLVPRKRIVINPTDVKDQLLKVPFSYFHQRATKPLFGPDA